MRWYETSEMFNSGKYYWDGRNCKYHISTQNHRLWWRYSVTLSVLLNCLWPEIAWLWLILTYKVVFAFLTNWWSQLFRSSGGSWWLHYIANRITVGKHCISVWCFSGQYQCMYVILDNNFSILFSTVTHFCFQVDCGSLLCLWSWFIELTWCPKCPRKVTDNWLGLHASRPNAW